MGKKGTVGPAFFSQVTRGHAALSYPLPSRHLMSAFKAYAEGISGKAHILALYLG